MFIESAIIALISGFLYINHTENVKIGLAIGITVFLVSLVLRFIPAIHIIISVIFSLFWGIFGFAIIGQLSIVAGIISGIAIFILALFYHLIT